MTSIRLGPLRFHVVHQQCRTVQFETAWNSCTQLGVETLLASPGLDCLKVPAKPIIVTRKNEMKITQLLTLFFKMGVAHTFGCHLAEKVPHLTSISLGSEFGKQKHSDPLQLLQSSKQKNGAQHFNVKTELLTCDTKTNSKA